LSSAPSPRPIAFCITELDPGGAEHALLQIVKRLDRSCWSPLVICLADRGPLVDAFEAAGIPVRCLGATSKWNLSVFFRLVSVLREHRPVLVQTFLFHANLLGRIAARFAGRPKVVSGIRVAERRGRWYLRLDRWTEFLVDRHVCVSSAVARFSEQAGLSPQKLTVIPNGVELERFAIASPSAANSLPQLPAGAQVALYVGRLDAQKGVDLLLEAAVQLRESLPDLHWWLAGDGPLRGSLEQQIEAAGLVNVHLLGRRDDIPGLMKSADVFVFPSRWEGMPNVILEAMASGLPVVSTEVEGIDELLVHGESAEISPREDASALAASLLRLLGSSELQKKYARYAQAVARERFTWDRVADAYAQLYDELLAD